MKQILYSAMILSLAFAISCDKNNDDKPVEPKTSLGKASFATDSTWKIPAANGALAQEWSDAVQTDSCSHKTTFDGGDYMTSSYNVDCRSNPNYKGDLFSWRAVAEVEGICPDGWRVPTTEDFQNLDKLLGGTGDNHYDGTTTQVDKYINTWGGAYGGRCYSDGSLTNQGLRGVYWSQSESSAANGFRMDFTTDGIVTPQFWNPKDSGFSLRCVQ